MKVIFYATILLSSAGTLRFCSSDTETFDPTTASLTESWTITGLKTPESALYDANRNIIYVSNINGFNNDQRDGDGFISLVSPNGTLKKLDWINGLNDPKGLGLWHEKLFVADIDQVVEVDVRKSEITNRYPMPGAIFLNDVTIDLKGTVFISDTGAGKIFQLKNGVASVFVEGEAIAGANGLVARKNELVEVSFATGNAQLIDYKTKTVTSYTSGIANADGLVIDRYDNAFISNWAGEVYYVPKSGVATKILDTKDQGIYSADINLLPGNTLLVPTFFANSLMAYSIDYN